MKNLIITKPMAIACLVLAASCTDFLDREPFADIASNGFYTTEQNLEIAAVGLYGALQDFYVANYPEIAELPADNAQNNNGATTNGGQFDKFNLFPNNGILASAWASSYRVILQSNKVLESLPNIEFVDDKKKEQIEGEAKFVRALTYFNLVRMFGKVPLDTLVLTQGEARQSIRNDEAEIYDVITNDLKSAAVLLPEAYTGTNIGRATKWAALTLLGKVYLTIHQFEEAIDPLHEVVHSGPYRLLIDYAGIFDPMNANHAESIFEIQFEGGTLGEGSRWSFKAHHRTLAEAMKISSANATIPTNNIVNTFIEQGESTSPRYVATIGWMEGTAGLQSHVKKHYMDHTMQNQSDDNWPLLRYADVLLMYAEVLNETSGTPPAEAIEYVNKVRRRAFGLPVDGNSAQDLDAAKTVSTQAFREAIYLERRLELAFEGHRWWDLVRTDMYVTVMNNYFGSNSPYKAEPYHKLYPVPQREIDINPLLKPNNDGYN